MKKTIFYFLLALVTITSCQKTGRGFGNLTQTADTASLNMSLDSADALYAESAYKPSLDYALQAADIARELQDTSALSDALSYVLADYQQLGMQDSAIIAARTLLEIDKKSGDAKILSNDYNSLAYIYIVAKRYQLAIEFIDKAIEMEQQVAGQPHLSIRYGLAAEAYNQLAVGRKDSVALREKALDFITKAYDKDISMKDTLHAARRLSVKGDILLAMNNYAEAEKDYRKALSMLLPIGERHSLAITYRQLGTLLLKQKDATEAIPYLEKALATAKEEGEIYTLMKDYQQLHEAYQGVDTSKSQEYLKAFTQAKDSVYTLESARSLSEFHARYDTDKEKENAARKHRQLVWTSIIGVIVIVVIIGVMSLLLRRKKIHNRKLREQVLQLKQQMQEQQQLFLEQINKKEENIVPELSEKDKSFIENVNKTIFDIIGHQELTVETVASSLCITSQTLRRNIKSILNVTAISYINSVRMDYAKQLLHERHDLSIEQIGQLCGFYEATHFSRAFKKVTGQNPSQVR